jgi:hypothetical protein
MANYTRQMTKDVVIHDQTKVYKGYTLFAPQYGNIAWLIDMEGNICHYWEMENPPGVNYYLLPSGNLLWIGRGPESHEELGGCGSEVVEVDWDGNEVWRYDDPRVNHDVKVLDNGNMMILRFVDLPEDVQAKVKGGAPGTEPQDGKMQGVQIREINRAKETVWEWNNWEYFDYEIHQECELCNRLSWGYTNSIDVFPNGDPVISCRELNKIIRISKKTGEIVWEIGPELDLGHQHDVDVLPNGNITIFDNGVHRVPRGHDTADEIASFCTSRALEIDPVKNEIVWEYIDPLHIMFTNFCGSNQKLPNGNYFICESRTGTFYEITPEKEIVWKYVSPFVINRPAIFGWTLAKLIFQAHRYGEDYEGLKGKDLDPEKYEWVIQPKSQETIDEEANVKSRLAKAGY